MTKTELKSLWYIKRRLSQLDREMRCICVLSKQICPFDVKELELGCRDHFRDNCPLGKYESNDRVDEDGAQCYDDWCKHAQCDEDELSEYKRLEKKIARIEKWIDEIDDPLVKDIIVYRFVKGFRWAKVAYLVGGDNTEDGVRMIVTRYLRK